jgi:hypothetical protein
MAMSTMITMIAMSSLSVTMTTSTTMTSGKVSPSKRRASTEGAHGRPSWILALHWWTLTVLAAKGWSFLAAHHLLVIVAL